MVLKDELLEAEVSLEGDVILQVGGGENILVQHEGLAGHELHESLAEVPHQPLLEQGHHQAALQGKVKTSNSFLYRQKAVEYGRVW